MVLANSYFVGNVNTGESWTFKIYYMFTKYTFQLFYVYFENIQRNEWNRSENLDYILKRTKKVLREQCGFRYLLTSFLPVNDGSEPEKLKWNCFDCRSRFLTVVRTMTHDKSETLKPSIVWLRELMDIRFIVYWPWRIAAENINVIIIFLFRKYFVKWKSRVRRCAFLFSRM